MAYLDDHPPVRSQMRCPRRERPSGVAVVHTAENMLDIIGQDSGAEAVAAFIQQRLTPGSYHDLVDSDSWVPLIRWECEAFQDETGSNSHAYGLSFALRTTDWSTLTPGQRDTFIENGARAAEAWARWLGATTGIVVPARRISRAQSELRVPGFISHAERDPARRTDPGANFPWGLFLERFAARMGYVPPSGDDDMGQPYSLWKFNDDAKHYCVAADCQSAYHVGDLPQLGFLQDLLRLAGGNPAVFIAERGKREAAWLSEILRNSAPGSTSGATAAEISTIVRGALDRTRLAPS